VTHGRGSEGERCEWRYTLPQNMVYPALLPLLPLMRTPRLPVVDWTDPPPPADLNGLVCFAERSNLVSAHVPSRFEHAIPSVFIRTEYKVAVHSRHKCASSWLASPPFGFYCFALLSLAFILILSLYRLRNHPAGFFVMTLHVLKLHCSVSQLP